MTEKRRLFRIVLPVIIILFGFGITVGLISSRKEPAKEEKKNIGALVEVVTVKQQDRKVIVSGTGTVQAAQEINIVPQVSGEVTYVAPSLAEGGFFQKNEVLFRIDDTDYRLELEQAKATEAQAELNLATIESKARIARAEWERLKKDQGDAPNPLVFYEPQLKTAKAEIASARSAIKQAELNLKRTEIQAPFNCRIRSESIDLGQYIVAGKSVAVIAGTDTSEVVVPMPLEELQWFHVPVQGADENGSSAVIHMDISGKDYEWRGRIIRSTGEVDTTSRMTKVVIEVKDPYNLLSKKTHRQELIAGAFVDVEIKGAVLDNVFLIPRAAVRLGSQVWVADQDNMLRIREITISRHERDHVLVRNGLKDGERIILTTLSGAADGMKIRVEQQVNAQ
jgi:RND family efflux transporter MFP subunit